MTGVQRALVKLETVTKTTCSRWHADYVAVRALVTYVGAGTEFVDNQHVDRKQLLLQLGVQDTGGYALRRGVTVHQAAPGDVLLLKGHAYEGFDGTPSSVIVCAPSHTCQGVARRIGPLRARRWRRLDFC